MKKIYQIFFLKFQNMFHNIIIFLINVIIIFPMLSSCNLFLNKEKIINYTNNFQKNNIFYRKIIYMKKNSNFFQNALQSGLNKSEIYDIIKSMEWQINFQKLNVGSYFNIIFLHKNEKNVQKNILLGVKLNNLKKIYYSIRAFNNHFYDIKGFHRSTNDINFSFIKKYPISSLFNLHRLHPVKHQIMPHLGIDLAMPEGTPVLCTHNGTIKKVTFDKISGFYIVLENKQQFLTKYMHLKKILVKIGDTVKKGEKIALSGHTGRTTGPHLHYEIWINNQVINPEKIKYISLYQLTEKEKKVFLEESKSIIEKMKFF